jgi:hypothetical protein
VCERRTTSYHTMESTYLVSLRPTVGVFGLSCAKLPEVFCSFRAYVIEQFKLDSAQWFACHVKLAHDDHQRSGPDKSFKRSEQISQLGNYVTGQEGRPGCATLPPMVMSKKTTGLSGLPAMFRQISGFDDPKNPSALLGSESEDKSDKDGDG